MPGVSISWKPELIVLSYTIAVLGCLVGVHLSEQFRICIASDKSLIGANQLLILMSISIGGVGVWAMHFIGMGALVIEVTSTGEIIPFKYDIGLTVASLISVIVCVYFGLLIASRDRVFEKDADTVGEMLVSDAQGLSMKQIKDKSALRNLAIFKGLQPLALGGVVTGTGVCIMHYIGMMAQETGLSMSWNAGIVFASVMIAVVVSTVAFWIIFRLLSLYPKYEALRVASALVMGVAVCGMHYTGMYGASYSLSDGDSKPNGDSVDQATALVACLVMGLLIAIFLLIAIICDLRIYYRHESRQLIFLNKEIDVMQQTCSTEVTPYLNKLKDNLRRKSIRSSGKKPSSIFGGGRKSSTPFIRMHSKLMSRNSHDGNIIPSIGLGLGGLRRASSRIMSETDKLNQNSSRHDQPIVGSHANTNVTEENRIRPLNSPMKKSASGRNFIIETAFEASKSPMRGNVNESKMALDNNNVVGSRSSGIIIHETIQEVTDVENA